MKIVLIKINLILLLLTSLSGKNLSYESISNDISYDIYNIDINNDGLKDIIANNKNGNELLFYTNKHNKFEKVYSGKNYSFDGIYSLVKIKEYKEGDNILYIKTVFNGAGGEIREYFISYVNNNWKLNKSISTYSTYLKIKVCIFNNSKNNEKCINIKNEDNNFILAITRRLKKKLDISFISREYIFSLLNEYRLLPVNLTPYNNLAYYLEQTGAYKESIYLLKKILEKYPNRIVAYINLGDAYLGNKQKDKAIKAYKKYIELMKKTGKEKKIPKRVLELVNDSKTLSKNQSQTTSYIVKHSSD
ncbi:tetratricopeptide repeat protein [Arcobacter sp.]|uniref:tetratricopeptide repeat protein n=1 Tax=Arcobacter sp. TaxID=1872629 RepID=UPI003C766CE6